jgi:hypothetical protein
VTPADLFGNLVTKGYSGNGDFLGLPNVIAPKTTSRLALGELLILNVAIRNF